MTKPKPTTATESASVKALDALRTSFTEIEECMADLRKSLGFPPKKIAALEQAGTLETRRKAATQLMNKMGYSVDHDNCKSGLVRIVGPKFSGYFFDIADFDGTDNNTVTK